MLPWNERRIGLSAAQFDGVYYSQSWELRSTSETFAELTVVEYI